MAMNLTTIFVLVSTIDWHGENCKVSYTAVNQSSQADDQYVAYVELPSTTLVNSVAMI
jgi:hypothetical protein